MGVVNGRVLFSAVVNRAGDRALLASTPTGAIERLSQQRPGEGWVPRGFYSVTTMGDNAYIASPDGLWETDGSLAGTRRFSPMDIRGQLTASGGRLFFPARRNVSDWDVWTSNGTSAGTRLLTRADSGDWQPYAFLGTSSTLFYLQPTAGFTASLMRTSLDSGQTVAVMQSDVTGFSPMYRTRLGENVYFHGQPAGSPRASLFRLNLQTEQITTVRPFGDDLVVTSYSTSSLGNDELVVVANRAGSAELFATRGVDGDARSVSDPLLAPPGGSVSIFGMKSVGQRLLFIVGVRETSSLWTSFHLWTSNGQPGGTQKLYSFAGLRFPSYSVIPQFGVAGGKVYFASYDPFFVTRLDDQLWACDIASPGDADYSGRVDDVDLAILARNYRAENGKSWSDGDFTGDGAVTFADLLSLARFYSPPAGGAPLAVAWSSALASVPEPGAVLMFSSLGFVTLRRRRRAAA
jgi:ELWxxDGT repeat protein